MRPQALIIETASRQLLAGETILVLAVLLAVTVGTIALLVLLMGAKIYNDRLEVHFQKRNKNINAAVARGDQKTLRHELLPAARGERKEQLNLLTVLALEEYHPSRVTGAVRTLGEAFRSLDMTGRLTKQLRSRKAWARGMALTLGSYEACLLDAKTASAYLDDKDPIVRLAASATLEAIGNDEAARALIEALRKQFLPDARLIERLRYEWAFDAVLDELVRPQTVQQRRINSALSRILGLIGNPDAIPGLITIAESGIPDERVQAMRGLKGCVRRADAEQRKTLASCARKAAASSQFLLEALAAETLGELGDPEDAELLGGLLRSQDWHVRKAAGRALLNLGGPGLAQLEAAAAGSDKYATQRAVEELDRAGEGRFKVASALAPESLPPGTLESEKEEYLEALANEALIAEGASALGTVSRRRYAEAAGSRPDRKRYAAVAGDRPDRKRYAAAAEELKKARTTKRGR